MSNFSVVKQDKEVFEQLVPVLIGAATQLPSTPPGMLKFQFGKVPSERVLCTFEWVSSVLYVDELLSNRFNYPYAYTGKHMSGLYECLGSSYLKRIQNDLEVSGGTFKCHRHYVYWDAEFSWHITCRDISVEKL